MNGMDEHVQEDTMCVLCFVKRMGYVFSSLSLVQFSYFPTRQNYCSYILARNAITVTVTRSVVLEVGVLMS